LSRQKRIEISFCCFILFSSLSSPRFRSILIIKTFGKKRKNRFAFLQKIIISYLKLGQKIVFFWVKKSSFANKNVSLILFQMFATSIQTFVNLLKNNFKLTILNYFKRFKEYFIKEMFLLLFLGNSELLELRLLETGFLSRFQLNP